MDLVLLSISRSATHVALEWVVGVGGTRGRRRKKVELRTGNGRRRRVSWCTCCALAWLANPALRPSPSRSPWVTRRSRDRWPVTTEHNRPRRAAAPALENNGQDRINKYSAAATELWIYAYITSVVEVFSCLEVGPQCHLHARTCENTDDSIPNSLGKADLCFYWAKLSRGKWIMEECGCMMNVALLPTTKTKRVINLTAWTVALISGWVLNLLL